MQVFAGTLLQRPPGRKYAAELRFAELAPRAPLPKPATLARWRKNLPAGFEIALRVPDECWLSPAGPLRLDEDLGAAVGWLTEAAGALEAALVVVATGAAITTGARDRDRVREYFAEVVRATGRVVVWRPTGLWEPAALQRIANELSIIGGIDAVDDPVPNTETVYATLTAEGLRRSFSHAQLLEVLDKLRHSHASRAFVSIDSAQSFREASLLQALSEGRA